MRKIFILSASLLLLAAAGSALAIDWPAAGQNANGNDTIQYPLTGQMIDADCCPVGSGPMDHCDGSQGPDCGDCPYAASQSAAAPACCASTGTADTAQAMDPSHCSGGGVCPFSASKTATADSNR